MNRFQLDHDIVHVSPVWSIRWLLWGRPKTRTKNCWQCRLKNI